MPQIEESKLSDPLRGTSCADADAGRTKHAASNEEVWTVASLKQHQERRADRTHEIDHYLDYWYDPEKIEQPLPLTDDTAHLVIERENEWRRSMFTRELDLPPGHAVFWTEREYRPPLFKEEAERILSLLKERHPYLAAPASIPPGHLPLLAKLLSSIEAINSIPMPREGLEKTERPLPESLLVLQNWTGETRNYETDLRAKTGLLNVLARPILRAFESDTSQRCPVCARLLDRKGERCALQHLAVANCYHEHFFLPATPVAVAKPSACEVTEDTDDDSSHNTGEEAQPSGKVQVITGTIPLSTDSNVNLVLREYRTLCSKKVGLSALPRRDELAVVEHTLATEFPWATQALTAVIEDLAGRAHYGSTILGLSPILFVGPPGTGKTRFAQRLSELLGSPSTVINLAGMGDAMFLKGTSRGWATGRPSRIIEFIKDTSIANPLFVLDEIDKAGQSLLSAGGNAQHALLDLLEPNNARRYHDVFLLTECDLSHCLYIATSNSLQNITPPLLSRLMPVFFPCPRAEDLPVIVRNMLGDLEREWGVPEGCLEYPRDEVGQWVGVPLRQVKRLLRGYFGRLAREAPHQLN